MEENKSLIIAGFEIVPADTFIEGGTDGLLAKMQAELDAYIPDLSTDKSRKEIASFSRKFSNTKRAVDDMGKELKSRYKSIIDPIDGERRRFRDAADRMRDQARKPLTDWENEQERIAKEAADLEQFNTDLAEALDMNAFFDREREVARKEAELLIVEAERLAKEAAARAEREGLERAAQIERDRLAREERIKKQAAENAKIEAEAKARKEIEEAEAKIQAAKDREEQLKREAAKAELDRLENIRLEKIRVETERVVAAAKAELALAESLAEYQLQQDEKDRAAKAIADKIKADAARKAADIEHQRAVNNTVAQKFMSAGMNESQAIRIVKDILRNPIPQITINY